MGTKLTDQDLQLLEAVKNSDLKKVKSLLEDGANPNAKQKKKSALDLVSPLAHDLKAHLIESGARQTSLKKDLVWAVTRANPNVVKLLIEYGADINLTTPIGTPIMAAVGRGCDESVEMLLEAKCDLGVTTTISTVLTKAIKADRPDLLEMVLKAGCDPDITFQPSGPTALFATIEHGSVDSARVLVENGANVDAVAALLVTGSGFTSMEKHHNCTPLHYAVLVKKIKLVELLLKSGANTRCKEGSGLTPGQLARERGFKKAAKLLGPDDLVDNADELLFKAIDSGKLEALESALDKGASLEARDSRKKTENFTPLQLAVYRGHIPLAQKLLAEGADPNGHEGGDKIPGYILGNMDEPDQLQEMGYSLNRTPLMLALLHGHHSFALELLGKGADANLTSGLGETAAHLAAAEDALEVLESLKKSKIKLDKAGRGRSTPLMEACRAGAGRAVEFLLANKAKTERKNSDGYTPLTLACSDCHLEVVKALLSAGADPNFIANEAPLYSACFACRLVPHEGGVGYLSVSWRAEGAFTYEPYPEEQTLEIVEALLEAGAYPSPKGNKPIQAAAQAGYRKVVERLVEAGAKPGSQDSFGNSPLDLAKMYKRDDVVKYLESLKKSSPKKKPKKAPVKPSPAPEYKAVYAPSPGFVKKLKQKSFKKVVESAEELCGSKAVFMDHHVEIHVNSDEAEKLTMLELQDRYLAQGVFLFNCSGGATKPNKLALIPSTRWQDALALMETNGINYDVASQNIIDWFEGWEENNPFRILGVSHNIVSGIFPNKIKKPKAFAESMYELCPDTVEQGMGTLEELVKDLKSNRRFFLWWD